MIFFKHVCYVCAHYYMHIHFLVCVCVYSAHVHVCSSSSPRELALLQALFSRAHAHFYRPTNRFQTTNCFQKSTVFKNPTVFKRRSRTHEFKTRTPVQTHKRFFQKKNSEKNLARRLRRRRRCTSSWTPANRLRLSADQIATARHACICMLICVYVNVC